MITNQHTIKEIHLKQPRTDFDYTPPALREVSLRVAAVNGINLGQGVSQVPAPPEVLEAAQDAIKKGFNRYGPAQGIPELREALLRKLTDFNHLKLDIYQILITGGATGAFETVVQAMINPGDEVILFRPFYPYHRNAVLRARGIVKICELQAPNWHFSQEDFLNCFTPKTKLIVITTPNNPTGKVFTREELNWIGTAAKERGVWCVTDEVYEYLTYDSHEHVSMGSIPELGDTTITMGSFAKTFSVTGWRVGYIAGPPSLMPLFRSVTDQLYVCAPTPLQHAIAHALKILPESYYAGLHELYTTKRQQMGTMLEKAGFEFSQPAGSYFFLVSTKQRFPDLTATQVLDKLIEQAGIGAVPTVDFVGPEAVREKSGDYLLRFCYSIPDDLMTEAAKRLGQFE